MSGSGYNGLDEVTFYTFLPWHLVKNGLLLGLGAFCIGLAFAHSVWWWIAVGIIGGLTLLNALNYKSTAVIVRGEDLVLRRGAMRMREYSLPIWQPGIEYDWSLLGRLFDYATIRCATRAGTIEIRAVACASTLKFLIADRRQTNAMLQNRPILQLTEEDLLNLPAQVQKARSTAPTRNRVER